MSSDQLDGRQENEVVPTFDVKSSDDVALISLPNVSDNNLYHIGVHNGRRRCFDGKKIYEVGVAGAAIYNIRGNRIYEAGMASQPKYEIEEITYANT